MTMVPDCSCVAERTGLGEHFTRDTTGGHEGPLDPRAGQGGQGRGGDLSELQHNDASLRLTMR